MGAVQFTVAWELPAIAELIMGALGIILGVIELDALDGNELPTEFVATIVKVYAVPLVNPKTVADVPLTVVVSPSGLLVTV